MNQMPDARLDHAHAAVRQLRALNPRTPQEAATLLLGIAGDGTGQTCLLEELAAVLVRIARRAAPALPADAAQYVTDAASAVQVLIGQQAGDYLAGALDLLEQPGRVPADGFAERHGIPVDDHDQPHTYKTQAHIDNAPTPAAAPVPAELTGATR